MFLRIKIEHNQRLTFLCINLCIKVLQAGVIAAVASIAVVAAVFEKAIETFLLKKRSGDSGRHGFDPRCSPSPTRPNRQGINIMYKK